MSVIIYDPKDAGREFINKKGKVIKIRKYYMTPKEMKIGRSRWLEEVKDVDKKIKKMVGPHFFNPYRYGIYHYQLQVLFLLGANRWHDLTSIVAKLKSYTLKIELKRFIYNKYGYHTAWDKFRSKSSRENAQRCKDHIGRIQENFVFLQRLSKLHPYGYKLHQVRAAVDIKRISKEGFEHGIHFYRLSTYDSQKEALPIKDFKDFKFPKHERRYVNNKFIGTIITKDKTIVKGIEI